MDKEEIIKKWIESEKRIKQLERQRNCLLLIIKEFTKNFDRDKVKKILDEIK